MADQESPEIEYLRQQQAKRIMDYYGGAQTVMDVAQRKLRELRLADKQDQAERLSDFLTHLNRHLTTMADWVDRDEIVDETKLGEYLAVNWSEQLYALLGEQT